MSLYQSLASARVFDLSHPLVEGMAVSPSHVPFTMALTRRHGDRPRADGSSGASELLVMSGHTGTHLDALCHIAADGRLHGGYDAAAAARDGRFSVLGVDSVPPLVLRAVLLDVAGSLGVDSLPPAHRITDIELDRVAAEQGLTVESGDAILVRTGWAHAHWGDRAAFVGTESGVPGVDLSGADWILSRDSPLAGTDTMAFERLAPGAGHAHLPVHRRLIAESGVYLVEMMNLDEMAAQRVYLSTLVLAPLRFVGATGSPVRPLAFAE
ncbi:MAG: cyclase family protein [Candidatus Dormiibacterota bacterium]